MDDRAECTHCRVLMTSWSAPGSPVRYWRCPTCGHAHSSLYGEVFRSGAGARLLARRAGPARPAPALPQASAEEIRWASLRARAARWYARLEREERGPWPPGASPRPTSPPAPGRALGATGVRLLVAGEAACSSADAPPVLSSRPASPVPSSGGGFHGS